jgi:transposase
MREIARLTSLSRNTIRKYLKAEVAGEPQYRRAAMPTKLTPFHAALRQALAADAHRPRQQRRTALALSAEIKAAGYRGGYTRVTAFIRAWRASAGQALVPVAHSLPIETGGGGQPHVLADHALGNAECGGDLLVGQLRVPLQSNHVLDHA